MADSRVALVTGTSKGLGEAIARRLMDDEFVVVGVSRSGTPKLHGPRFVDTIADLSDPAMPHRLMTDVVERMGGVDVLVNNAAAIQYADAWTLDPADFDLLLAINLTAPWLLSQAAVRHWQELGTPGNIINICSVESDVAWADPPQAGYATTKGGLLGLTRAMGLDLAASGIQVNGVAPGIIRTELTPADESAQIPRIPAGRLGRPDEIGAVVSFLCGSDSTYLNGEVVFVDGGYRLP